MIRVSRVFLAFSCVLALSLGIAARAHAGAFGNPTSSDVCNGELFATDFMTDPNTGPFNGASTLKDCLSLCKQAEADCKNFSRRSAACYQADNSNSASYGKQNCKVFTSGSELKACRADVDANAKDNRASLKAELADAIAACEDWGAVCQATCAL
jgi:hypothetical protein